MRFNATKPKKRNKTFLFSKKQPEPEATKAELLGRKKMIERHLREKGCTICPPAYSRVDF